MSKSKSQRGGIVLELMVVVIGLSTVTVGISDLLLTQLTQIEMQLIRGQMQLGKFDAAVEARQDPATPNQVFYQLQGGKAVAFLRGILTHAGNFVDFKQIGVFVQLYYISVDPQLGKAAAILPVSAPPRTSAGLPIWCAQNSSRIMNDLAQYAQSHLTSILAYSATGGVAPIGQELFDVSIGSQTFKQYLPFFPVVVVGLCRGPKPPLLTHGITYFYHMAAPRSLS